jgi:hypothetical protein
MSLMYLFSADAVSILRPGEDVAELLSAQSRNGKEKARKDGPRIFSLAGGFHATVSREILAVSPLSHPQRWRNSLCPR